MTKLKPSLLSVSFIIVLTLAILLEGCSVVSSPKPVPTATSVPASNSPAPAITTEVVYSPTPDPNAPNFVKTRKLLANSVWSHSFDFSRDGHWIAYGNNEKVVLVDLNVINDKNPPDQTALYAAEHVTSVAFSPNSKIIALGDYAGNIVLWDIAKKVDYTTVLHVFDEQVPVLAFSPDGRWLAAISNGCGCDNDAIRLWDLSKGSPTITNALRLRSLSTGISAAVFSKDSTLLATGNGSGAIYLWNMQNLDETPRYIKGPSDGVNSLAFSNDKVLAAGTADRTVMLWDIQKPDASPQVLEAFPNEPPGTPGVTKVALEVDSVAFSSNGKMLLAGCGDGTLRVWRADQTDKYDNKRGATRIALERYSGDVNAVRFSPDDKMLAAESFDGISLWNIR